MKKFLVWSAIVVVIIVAILLVFNTYYVWSTGARLEKQLAELRAAGDPISLKDLAQPPIPPEKNAATFINRAIADVVAIEKETLAIFPKTYYPDTEINPTEQQRLQKVFDAYPNVMPLLEKAAACPDYDPQLDYTVPAEAFMATDLDHVSKKQAGCPRAVGPN